jgi:hypothetical protein
MNEQSPRVVSDLRAGSHDGEGAGDHDQVFVGYRAYVFSTRQLARLLQVRGEVLEARMGHGQWASDVTACHP